MEPRVTVAIPNYNQGRFISSAIESVLGQTLGDYELIVSDNASTDNSVDVIAAYRDPRLRLIRQPRNIGLVPNWNVCLREARGAYFKLVQADDLILPRCLELGVAALDSSVANICLMSYGRISESGAILREQAEILDGDGEASAERVVTRARYYSGFVPPSGNMVRTRPALRVGGFGTERNICGDLLLWAALIGTGTVALVSAESARERVHPAQARRRSDPCTVLGDWMRAISVLQASVSSDSALDELSEWKSQVIAQSIPSMIKDLLTLDLRHAGKMMQEIARAGRNGGMPRALFVLGELLKNRARQMLFVQDRRARGG